MYRGAPASPIILLSGWANFGAWMGTRSKSFRTGLRYDRRRISAQGELIFREIGQAGAGSFIDWLMAKKGRWLDDRRIKRNWLRESRTSDFYTALIGLPRSGVVAFVLELGGKAIAGCICLRSSATLEFYITAFDPKLSAFSPGNLLIEDVATWCIARGLDFDFRLTHDPYKLRWSGVFREYEVFILGVTPVGDRKSVV